MAKRILWNASPKHIIWGGYYGGTEVQWIPDGQPTDVCPCCNSPPYEGCCCITGPPSPDNICDGKKITSYTWTISGGPSTLRNCDCGFGGNELVVCEVNGADVINGTYEIPDACNHTTTSWCKGCGTYTSLVEPWPIGCVCDPAPFGNTQRVRYVVSVTTVLSGSGCLLKSLLTIAVYAENELGGACCTPGSFSATGGDANTMFFTVERWEVDFCTETVTKIIDICNNNPLTDYWDVSFSLNNSNCSGCQCCCDWTGAGGEWVQSGCDFSDPSCTSGISPAPSCTCIDPPEEAPDFEGQVVNLCCQLSQTQGADYLWMMDHFNNALVTSNFDNYLSDGTAEFGSDRQLETGVRFINVKVPQGATITQAILTYKLCYKIGTPGTVTVRGIDEDNVARPVSYADANDNALTMATADMDTSSWPTTTGTATDIAVDVTSIVQEIVNRAGWAYDNALGFQHKVTTTGTNNRARHRQDTSGANEPTLVILWE
jgi:hypothetical protein